MSTNVFLKDLKRVDKGRAALRVYTFLEGHGVKNRDELETFMTELVHIHPTEAALRRYLLEHPNFGAVAVRLLLTYVKRRMPHVLSPDTAITEIEPVATERVPMLTAGLSPLARTMMKGTVHRIHARLSNIAKNYREIEAEAGVVPGVNIADIDTALKDFDGLMKEMDAA